MPDLAVQTHSTQRDHSVLKFFMVSQNISKLCNDTYRGHLVHASISEASMQQQLPRSSVLLLLVVS